MNQKRSKYTLTTPAALNPKPIKKSTTHLYFNDKRLTNIEDIKLPKSLSILYLHNNRLSKIESKIQLAINLKNLYLQKNKITKIENLDSLKNLKKLYLGFNEISVVEGLEKLSNLEELHIEKQVLKYNESLCFDPRSVAGLAENLKVINISYNNITTIEPLKPLKSIIFINASFNKLEDIHSVSNTLISWYYLKEANFQGNPIVKLHHYRENLISNTFQMSLLDNKEITETIRCFIKRLEKEKLNQSSKHVLQYLPVPSVAKNYPMSMQKAISQSILQNTKPFFNSNPIQDDIEIEEIYVPWKAITKSTGNIKKKGPEKPRYQHLQRNPEISRRVPF